MPSSRYKYDPENLNYDRLDSRLGARVWRVLIYVAAIMVIGILLNVVYSLFFDTPRERQIRRENEMLMDQYRALSERKATVDTVMKEIREVDKDIYRVIFETEPLEETMLAGSGASYQHLLNTGIERIVDYTAGKLDSMNVLINSMSQELDFLMIKGENKAEVLLTVPAIQPIDNPDLSLLASGFGYRVHPIYKIPKMHSGIDFSAPVGTPVKVTADGTVESITRSNRGLGNQVLVDHGFGFKTLYACLDEIQTRRGRSVKRGEQIATVGESGLTVAPHLHYEIIMNGKQVNPINFFFLELGPREYDQMILISLMSGQSFD